MQNTHTACLDTAVLHIHVFIQVLFAWYARRREGNKPALPGCNNNSKLFERVLTLVVRNLGKQQQQNAGGGS